MTDYLERDSRPRLAYVYTKGCNEELPAVMFLGGFKSDMEGTKALYLEQQCKSRSQSFLRFDYSGHGVSGGAFEDGTIGKWTEDALAVFDRLTAGPVILVGSSMGGWIALLLALERPERIAGLVGIAAAPDFTREIEQSLSAAQKQDMQTQGRILIPSDYSDEPYIFTRALIEDGAKNCLLDRDMVFSFPIKLVQGMQDRDVPWQTAFRIKNAAGGDVEVVLVESGDHRLSTPENLALIDKQVQILSGLTVGG